MCMVVGGIMPDSSRSNPGASGGSSTGSGTGSDGTGIVRQHGSLGWDGINPAARWADGRRPVIEVE